MLHKIVIHKTVSLQIEFKMHLETKSNSQKESNTLEGIKVNERAK